MTRDSVQAQPTAKNEKKVKNGTTTRPTTLGQYLTETNKLCNLKFFFIIIRQDVIFFALCGNFSYPFLSCCSLRGGIIMQIFEWSAQKISFWSSVLCSKFSHLSVKPPRKILRFLRQPNVLWKNWENFQFSTVFKSASRYGSWISSQELLFHRE